MKPSSDSPRSLPGVEDEEENPKPIVEANGWIINARGQVELVAYSASHPKSKLAQRAVSGAMPEGLIACPTD